MGATAGLPSSAKCTRLQDTAGRASSGTPRLCIGRARDFPEILRLPRRLAVRAGYRGVEGDGKM